MDLIVETLVVESAEARRILSIDALTVPQGSLIGVQGPSGAGKSTFLYAIAGLLPEAKGRVLWDGTDILSMAEARRTGFRGAKIGMVFQDFLLFEELDAQANADLVKMFQSKSARAEIAARAQSHLSDLSVPTGARHVGSFSGGERQRVAVARALAHDPAILLADEPTASLHRDAADQLIDDLSTLVRQTGKTLIAVSHDTTLLSRMDRILTFEDGRLVA